MAEQTPREIRLAAAAFAAVVVVAGIVLGLELAGDTSTEPQSRIVEIGGTDRRPATGGGGGGPGSLDGGGGGSRSSGGGGGGSGSSGGGGGGPRSPGGVGGGSKAGSAPQLSDLEAYRERCERLDRAGAAARVLYEPRREMTRGRSTLIAAAVTLDRSAPRDIVLRRPGAAEEPGVLVSCVIQARLTAPKSEFDVDESGWLQRSLLGTDTARWSWQVTPKVGGDRTLVLEVRPIVRLRDVRAGRPLPTSVRDSDGPETSNVQQYESAIHVNVPWSERPQEAMSRIAVTLKVAEGLVQAATALVIAVTALLAALGIRRRRRRQAT